MRWTQELEYVSVSVLVLTAQVESRDIRLKNLRPQGQHLSGMNRGSRSNWKTVCMDWQLSVNLNTRLIKALSVCARRSSHSTALCCLNCRQKWRSSRRLPTRTRKSNKRSSVNAAKSCCLHSSAGQDPLLKVYSSMENKRPNEYTEGCFWNFGCVTDIPLPLLGDLQDQVASLTAEVASLTGT